MKATRLLLALVAFGLLATLGSCTRTQPGAARVPGPLDARTFSVLDDFEVESAWSVESAGNAGLIEYVGQTYFSGQRALKVTAFKQGRRRTAIHKDVDYDFSCVSRLEVDIFNASDEPVAFAFAFNAGRTGRYFETLPFRLRPGANNGIVFTLNRQTFKPLDGRATFRRWESARHDVTGINLLFFEGRQPRAEFTVDNLRCDRPYQTVNRGIRPRIINVLPSAMTLGVYRRLDVALDFEGAFSDPFDSDEVAVWAEVRTPSDTLEHVRGFLAGYDEARDKYLWRIRYAPREVGQHVYEVHVRTREGEAATGPFALDVVDDGAPGFVRVSRADPTMFERSRGQFFYPFGQNVCWTADYEHYFDKMRGYGGNVVRIWMCPWHLWLEGRGGPGVYDLKAAENLDRIVELAERYGITILLVFDYHGMVRHDWSRNPYNVANGGPCAVPEDFWRNEEAKRLYRRRLDYIVARWGASANVFAWELFNEVNLARRAEDADVVAWHAEMAGYLKAIDPYGHLVTTSTGDPGALVELWRLAEIDFTQAHMYTPSIFDAVRDNWLAFRVYNKPYLIGEFGRGFRAPDDQADPDGILLSAGLWLAATTPAGGNALPWWWDTYIDPNDLYGRFAAVARFLDGEDRRGRHDEFFERRLELGANGDVRMQGIANRTSAFVYVFSPERIRAPKEAGSTPVLARGFVLDLDGMLDGEYTVEIWRAESGDVAQTLSASAADGRLQVPLPASAQPLGVRVKRAQDMPLEIDLTPQGE
jgi:hypothetical protein